jgi:hypothetical protein
MRLSKMALTSEIEAFEVYQSTGSLLNVIALHMLYNTSITLPEWTIYHAPF